MVITFPRSSYLCLYDDEDHDIVASHKWTVVTSSPGKHYVISRCGKYLLHRLICGISNRSLEIDHINGDGLDNRRRNLRVCNRSQNAKNRKISKHSSTKFKGVYKNYGSSTYRARINVDGQRISLGSYKTPEEAHEAYVYAAKKYHGEFCRYT